MAVYTHQTDNNILVLTKRASGTVTVRRFVKFSGAQCDTQGELALGVAIDGAADTEPYPVAVEGTCLVEAGEPLAQNIQVMTSSAGKAITATKAKYILGITKESVSATGELVPIMIGGKKLSTSPTTTTSSSSTSSSSSSSSTTTA